MSPSAVHPEDEYKVVETDLNHYLDPKDGGHDHYITGIASYYRRKFDAHTVKIGDIRGREDQFDLNTQGFQYIKHESAEKDFDDVDHIKTVLYPESEQLLKEVTGATRVKVFSHILRNDSREKAENAVESDPALKDDNAPISDVVPARFIHIDQSEKGAMEVLDDNVHPPELADKLKKTRWGIINLWRPIRPVMRDPLAFCDARTARDSDLVPIPVYFPPKGSGQRYSTLTEGDHFELLYCKYNPGHEWYYANEMRPGEALMIKCFDSIRDGKTARRVPHSAFVDPSSTSDMTRESIEIRCLVFWEDQPLEG